MGLSFSRVLDVINKNYDFTPTAFGVVASAPNTAGQNEGACRVLAFAKDQNLDKGATLQLFAEHYQNVSDDPDGETHQNIRLLMAHGLDGVWFEKNPLSRKPTYDAGEVAGLIAGS